jgi:ketosteroid isomerase-like protein
MKKIFMTALMLIGALALSATVSQAQGNKAGLEKTVNAFFGILKTNDVDKIKAYYTADYTFTGPDGKMMGMADRIKMLKDGTGAAFQSVADITVRTYGNAGLATGVVTTKASGAEPEQSRFLQVWAWQGEQWRLAASQVTPIK